MMKLLPVVKPCLRVGWRPARWGWLALWLLALAGPGPLSFQPGQAWGAPAVSANPQVQVLFQSGVRYLLAGRLEESEAKFLQALALEPQNSAIRWELGWAYWKDNRWDEVIGQWERVARLNPAQKDLEKYLGLAKDYRELEAETAKLPPFQLGPPAPGKPPLGPPGALVITAVGDLMMGSDFGEKGQLPPDEGRGLLAPVAGLLAGDVVFANLEGPLTRRDKSDKCKTGKRCFAFRTPPSMAARLKEAGFTLLNQANNHAADFGPKGMGETAASLAQHGMAGFGLPGRPWVMVEARGKKVAFLGVGSSACCLHVSQTAKVAALVRELKQKADLVVVSMHAGAEGVEAAHVPQGQEVFLGEDRGNVRQFAHAMVDAGAGLVLGHGPHTIRAMEYYQGRLIVYSLGNFLGYRGFSVSGHLRFSYVLQLAYGPDGRLAEARALPLVLNGEAMPEPDPQGRAVALMNKLGREDFGPQAALMDEQGVLQPPPKGVK